MLVHSKKILLSAEVVTASLSVVIALTKNRVPFIIVDPRENCRISWEQPESNHQHSMRNSKNLSSHHYLVYFGIGVISILRNRNTTEKKNNCSPLSGNKASVRVSSEETLSGQIPLRSVKVMYGQV